MELSQENLALLVGSLMLENASLRQALAAEREARSAPPADEADSA